MTSISLIVATISLSPFHLHQQSGSKVQGINDDRDVIQTALLTFFKPEEWHSADWGPKHQVILRPQFSSMARVDFKSKLKSIHLRLREEVTGLEKALKKAKNNPTEVSRLNRYLQVSRPSLAAMDAISGKELNGKYVPAQIMPIKSMKWDKRIRISTERGGFGSRIAGEEAPVVAYASPPSLSPDGSIAIVSFGIPWSMHSADVDFVLERTPAGWIRRRLLRPSMSNR